MSDVVRDLESLRPTIEPVADAFANAGHRLYLVGGVVRDLRLGRLSGFDIDFTTDARPATIKQLIAPLASAVWTQGERFGTIGATVNGQALEITTHRAENYDPESRKPVVSFGDKLEEDLSRRDFTINAMAVEVPGDELHDPFGGAADLEARVLRTPLSPEVSFTDDPLRMLRAARFVSRFGLSVDPGVLAAARELASRIKIVSVERVADETERLLLVDDPTAGLAFLRETGLLSLAIWGDAAELSEPEVRLAGALAAATEGSELSCAPLVRRAGLLWSCDVAAVLRRLNYSNHDQRATTSLVTAVRGWIHGGDGGDGGDAARSPAARGRRLLSQVESPEAPLALARNLAAYADDVAVVRSARQLIGVVQELQAADDVGPYHAPLTGGQIMRVLDIAPGPIVGQAQRLLRSHRLDHGPMSTDEAVALIRQHFA